MACRPVNSKYLIPHMYIYIHLYSYIQYYILYSNYIQTMMHTPVLKSLLGRYTAAAFQCSTSATA